MEQNDLKLSFWVSVGLSVVAVFLFGLYSIGAHISSSAVSPASESLLGGKTAEAFRTFKLQLASSIHFLKNVLQQRTQDVQNASPVPAEPGQDLNAQFGE